MHGIEFSGLCFGADLCSTYVLVFITSVQALMEPKKLFDLGSTTAELQWHEKGWRHLSFLISFDWNCFD